MKNEFEKYLEDFSNLENKIHLEDLKKVEEYLRPWVKSLSTIAALLPRELKDSFIISQGYLECYEDLKRSLASEDISGGMAAIRRLIQFHLELCTTLERTEPAISFSGTPFLN